MVESVINRSVVKSSEIVVAGLRPVADALAHSGVIFLRRPGGRYHKARLVLLTVVEELTQDTNKEKNIVWRQNSH